MQWLLFLGKEDKVKDNLVGPQPWHVGPTVG